MAVSVNLSKALDKAWEDKSLEEILAAPPSALAGLTERHDELLRELNIKTIADLGSNKYFAVAGVLVALSTKTGLALP
jgi:predicted RecB family nuclease